VRVAGEIDTLIRKNMPYDIIMRAKDHSEIAEDSFATGSQLEGELITTLTTHGRHENRG
jgi:hypothetical protein